MFRNITAVTFKVGEYCNLNCVYCFQQYETKTRTRTFDKYEQLVSFLSKLSLADNLEFKVTGGEPSLYIDEIRNAWHKLSKLERMKDVKIQFTTISNGSNIEGLLGLMDEGILNPGGCKISWDGIYSASKSRKPKNKKFTDEFFKDKIVKLGKSKYRKDVLVRMALTPNTVDDIADSFKFALDCGCRKLEYYFLSDCEEYRHPDFISKFNIQIEKIMDLYMERKFTLANFDTLIMNEVIGKADELRAITCRHLGKALYIEIDGKIAPCGYFSKDALFPDQTMYIGDIENGFYYDKVKSFIDQYKCAPMCTIKQCHNFHCFECPAAALFRKGNMADKLYQTCAIRSSEKATFDWYYKHYPELFNYSNEYMDNRYSYIKSWNIDYSMPDLPYSEV